MADLPHVLQVRNGRRSRETVKLSSPDSLKEFASNFKLSTPVPEEILPYITKDPAKQKEIQASQLQDNRAKLFLREPMSGPHQQQASAPFWRPANNNDKRNRSREEKGKRSGTPDGYVTASTGLAPLTPVQIQLSSPRTVVSLKQFASDFKLSTPVPEDLLPQLTKDPAKQKEIQDSRLRDIEKVKAAREKKTTA